MKRLMFLIALVGLLGACTSKQENTIEGSKEIAKDTTQEMKETKEKTEKNEKVDDGADNPEVKETDETVREEP